MSKDILFKTNEFIFSYRVQGILIKDGKVLLQKPLNDDGYSLPGGHVSFGETATVALVREYKEELNLDIKVDRLVLVGEVFFPWGNRPCQQIGLYFAISLIDENQIPLSGSFYGYDELNNIRVDLEFSWIQLKDLHKIKVYPENLQTYLISLPDNTEYFLYKQ